MLIQVTNLRGFLQFKHIAKRLEETEKNERELIEKALKGNILPGYTKEDLDLIQIALTTQKTQISPQDFLEHTILENKDSLLISHIFHTLEETKIVQEGYLTLEHPFKKHGKPKKDLTEFLMPYLNEPSGIRYRFEPRPFKTFDEFVREVRFYDDFFSVPRPRVINYLLTPFLANFENSFDYTREKKDTVFQQFLNENNLTFAQTLTLASTLTREVEMMHTDYTILKHFAPQDQYTELAKRQLVEQDHGYFRPTNKARTLIASHIQKSQHETPKETLDHVILPQETKQRIIEAINQLHHQDQFKKWKIHTSYGNAVTLNFHGPPGTGKTLAARAIANHLNKPLATVNYAELQSMWLGETEKNIAETFKQATETGAVLFFDEADSIAQDRKQALRSWEISQTNVMLKELEKFEGVCIFATNLKERYDEAFNRRLSAHIEFALPDNGARENILNLHLPTTARSKNVNLRLLATQSEGLSGGDLKNVVLNAARKAAYLGKARITHTHLQEALEAVTGSKSKELAGYFG